MLSTAMERFPRLELVPIPTPLERLERLSQHMRCDIWIKRDDLTPLAMGGNKARKLEYLGADALRASADTLVTAGAIQSNHVRQTAALAAHLGMDCHALLENPIDSAEACYLHNGNRLLLDLFGATVEAVDTLDDPDAQLEAVAARLRAQGKRPYVLPVGGSSALGALGYVRAGLELAQQISKLGQRFAALVVASGSAGTQAGLSLALAYELPELPVIGITVSRPAAAQRPKVEGLIERCAALLGVEVPQSMKVQLWDEYHGPRYGEPNEGTLAALHKLARCEGLLLDPVYTGKAMDGLLDGIALTRFAEGPVLFLHTGGTPALFAYPPATA